MKTLLREEFQSEIEELGKMAIGTDEYKVAVDGVTKLADRLIEIDKIDVSHEEKMESLRVDREIKEAQMKDERKDRTIKNVITVGTTAATVGLTVWGALKTWKFEETGTVTSMFGRGFMQKLLPKK
jgi:predicted phosphoribosyltransferase